MNKYKQAYNERKKGEKKRIENINKIEKNNQIQIEKMKNEREKRKERNIIKQNENKNRMNQSYQKTYQDNVNQTQKLKDELSKLELLEVQYIENIKKTQEFIKNNNEDEKIRFDNYEKIKFYNNIDNKYKRYYKPKIRSRSAVKSTKRRNKKNIGATQQYSVKKNRKFDSHF